MKESFSSQIENIRVLVVDDYPMTRSLVTIILKEIGFKSIDQADSGNAALRRLSEEHYPLIICDWNMPAPSGVEVLRRVRNSDSHKDSVFIMLTAENLRSNVDEAVAAGVSTYIVKPFTAEVIIGKIKALQSNILKAAGLKV